jgi:hypothetical protein
MSKWGTATPKERRNAPAGTFCGPNRSYPVADKADFDNAVHALGRAKGDTAPIIACMKRKAKAAGWALPDAWKPASKDIGMNETLVHFGGSVKALGDGRVGGYLVMYGDEVTTDLVGDYFTKETDYDFEDGKKTAVYYAHGLDKKIGSRRIGTGTMKSDDVGVWLEAQLNLRDDYEKAIYNDLATKDKLGWSSGTANHLVTRRSFEAKSGSTVHEILTWPLGLDASLTPTPAEPRIQAVALKSLAPLIGMDEPCGCDDNTKNLPSGMSYDDLRSFLQDELNEDIGDSDDPYGGGLWICDIYDDNLIYRDDENLFRIPYTVTAGNDAAWGTPESVVRTTVYITPTDGDDDTNDAAPMMASKHADVTALKEGLTRSMTFSDHADIATSAMEGFVTRAGGLTEMSTKAGRVISAANRDKLKRIHAGMMTAHTAMEGHLQAINDMLLSTDPDAKKDIEDFAALRTQFVRLQSGMLHLTD